MKANIKIYLALAVLLAIAGVILYLKQKKKQKEEDCKGETSNKEIDPEKEFLFEKQEFPLKLGSIGRRVEQLQRYLSDKRGAKVSPTGILDEKTMENIKGFLKMDEVNEASFKSLRMSDFKTFGKYAWDKCKPNN